MTPTATPTPPPTITPTPTRGGATDPSAFPPFPNTYKGKVFVGGDPAPGGIRVFARIGAYQSPSAVVSSGGYLVVVGPPSDSFLGGLITFHAVINDVEVQALETAIYEEVNLATQEHLLNTRDLHFP